MEDLIVNAHVLYDDRAGAVPSRKPPLKTTRSRSSSPISNELPPAPPARSESATSSDYGVTYTQISNTLLQPEQSSSESPTSRDFTPSLPPRPGNSIHPSHRAANQSRSADYEEEDEMPPALPPRPPKSEARAAHVSEGSISGSQSSPLSERHDDSLTGTEVTIPSARPSSPASAQSHNPVLADASAGPGPDQCSAPVLSSQEQEEYRTSHERPPNEM